jgi:hypothetical protein
LAAHLYALLVGINDYPHPSLRPLRGCLNDVAVMRDVLVDDFGVPPGQVLVLPQEQATRAGIEAAFRDHLVAAGRRAADGDLQDRPAPGFLFYFSGHGSQAEDPTGVEPDGLDETIVPYDGRDDDVYDIKDFELAAWLATGWVRQLSNDQLTKIFGVLMIASMRHDCSVQLPSCTAKINMGEISGYHAAHDVASVTTFVLAGISQLLISRSVHRGDGWRYMRLLSIASGTTTLVLFLLMSSGLMPEWVGAIQRVIVSVACIWVSTVGLHLYRFHLNDLRRGAGVTSRVPVLVNHT